MGAVFHSPPTEQTDAHTHAHASARPKTHKRTNRRTRRQTDRQSAALGNLSQRARAQISSDLSNQSPTDCAQSPLARSLARNIYHLQTRLRLTLIAAPSECAPFAALLRVLRACVRPLETPVVAHASAIAPAPGCGRGLHFHSNADSHFGCYGGGSDGCGRDASDRFRRRRSSLSI